MRQITMNALVKRINRRLAKEDRAMRKSRRNTEFDLGEYFVVDVRYNLILVKYVDPVEWGRELGVLRAGESVEE